LFAYNYFTFTFTKDFIRNLHKMQVNAPSLIQISYITFFEFYALHFGLMRQI